MEPKYPCDPEVAKKALLAIREMGCGRDGTASPARVSDQQQSLVLAEARFLAISILLEVEPTVLGPWLDRLAWRADFTEETWNAARNEAGVPIPPISGLNSGVRTSWPTFTWLPLGEAQGRPTGT
jgi:hypothetical protein